MFVIEFIFELLFLLFSREKRRERWGRYYSFDQVRSFFPGLQEDDLRPHQTGIQARLAGHQDWVIEFGDPERRCLNLLGIDSPGLTGSLAIARHVKELLKLHPDRY